MITEEIFDSLTRLTRGFIVVESKELCSTYDGMVLSDCIVFEITVHRMGISFEWNNGCLYLFTLKIQCKLLLIIVS